MVCLLGDLDDGALVDGAFDDGALDDGAFDGADSLLHGVQGCSEAGLHSTGAHGLYSAPFVSCTVTFTLGAQPETYGVYAFQP